MHLSLLTSFALALLGLLSCSFAKPVLRDFSEVGALYARVGPGDYSTAKISATVKYTKETGSTTKISGSSKSDLDSKVKSLLKQASGKSVSLKTEGTPYANSKHEVTFKVVFSVQANCGEGGCRGRIKTTDGSGRIFSTKKNGSPNKTLYSTNNPDGKQLVLGYQNPMNAIAEEE